MGGLRNCWSRAKNDNCCYVLNKLVSVVMSSVFAFVTINLTATKGGESCATSNYSLIYWLLFVFYSFQALDELIEMYSVLFKRSKGALGLMFEMNYFMGFGLTIYVLTSVFNHPECADSAPTKFKWLWFQTIVFFIACALMLILFFCMCGVQQKVKVKAKEVEQPKDE